MLQLTVSQGQICSPDSLIQRAIKATNTDSNIDWELHNHQIYLNPTCTQKGTLVIHLVGSFDNPANTRYFPALAANNGYKVINLKYPNNIAALSTCDESTDPSCFEGYRAEIVYGTEASSAVDVDASNSIINRIEKLLRFLDENYPSENWDNFINNSGEINWSSIILSGHSQGGGHAAYLAKRSAVQRVLMFASPNDYSNHFSAPAPWVRQLSETPDSCYYALSHLFDNVNAFSKQYAVWNEMRMTVLKDSMTVDNAEGKYGNSRILYSELEGGGGFADSHNMVIIDDYTPIQEATPIFGPVWTYMLGLSAEISATDDAFSIPGQVHIFPNPSSSMMYINAEKEITKLELYSPVGNLLETTHPFQKKVSLDVSSYKGLLVLRLTFGKHSSIISKFIAVP